MIWIAEANKYLKRRRDINAAGEKDGFVIDLESSKVSFNGTRAAAIAAKWLRGARFEAIESEPEQ